MTLLYFDCFSGAAGDMILGALLDAGLPLDDLRDALGSLALDREAVWTERVTRAGVSATRLHVRGESPSPDHAHDHSSGHRDEQRHTHDHEHAPEPEQGHDHGHAEHRTLAEIFRLIDGAALSEPAKERAQALFVQLAEVEAAIHGTPVDKVHLHEVGALDSIIDIVGTVYALEALGVDRVVASSLNVGSGSIRSAHGLYPVPAPATTRLLQGSTHLLGAAARRTRDANRSSTGDGIRGQLRSAPAHAA